MLLKTCTKCNKEKSEEHFHWRTGKAKRQSHCMSCRNEEGRKYNRSRKEELREYHLQKRYQISNEEYEKILVSQNNVCAICGKSPKKNKLSVDHDHITGQVRGLLCVPCNRAIGTLGDCADSIENVLVYLQKGVGNLSFDEYFIRQAHQVALKSNDPRTKVGAILVKEKKIIATGCNCIPEGVSITPERLEPPLKYLYMEHAERNVLRNVNGEGCDMFLTLFPCSECARGVIQSKVARVVVSGESEIRPHWAESMQTARDMMAEAGIQVVQL